jgi:hypothetical protein
MMFWHFKTASSNSPLSAHLRVVMADASGVVPKKLAKHRGPGTLEQNCVSVVKKTYYGDSYLGVLNSKSLLFIHYTCSSHTPDSRHQSRRDHNSFEKVVHRGKNRVEGDHVLEFQHKYTTDCSARQDGNKREAKARRGGASVAAIEGCKQA